MIDVRCRWCGSPFKLVELMGAKVYICGADGCFQRCLRWVLTVRQPNPERKAGVTRPRLMFLPLPGQVDGLEAVEASRDGGPTRILLGGSAGGAKSHFLRWMHYTFALRYPGLRTLILRRTFPELETTHILRAEGEVKWLGAEYGKTNRMIRWSNGSLTKFGHSADPEEVTNYLSSEWDLISFDELVTFEREQAMLIASRARSTRDDGWRALVVSGTNPGGPEAAWVKEWYIDQSVDRAEFPDYRPEAYKFVPIGLSDNPYLGTDYEQTLRELPPVLRKAYLEGSWDAWAGQFFPEWDKRRHVVEWPGFDPRGCRVWCGIDWGYVSHGVCLWAAVGFDGQLYVFDEYTFRHTVVSEVAEEIRRRSAAWGVKPVYVADTQMWGGADQSGESMAETMQRLGVPLVQADKDRVNGWARVRHWLKDAPNGRPWLQVHPRCTGLTRTFPQLASNKHRPEDVDSDGPDHWGDALRYLIAARPAPGGVLYSQSYPPGSLGAALARQRRRENAGKSRLRRHA